MPIPILHHLSSPDLERGSVPADLTSCAVAITARIGPPSGGTENFGVIVVTPDHVLRGAGVRWGRGYLIVDQFSWETVEAAINKLLPFADCATWKESAAQLAREMHWEYDGYSEFVSR